MPYPRQLLDRELLAAWGQCWCPDACFASRRHRRPPFKTPALHSCTKTALHISPRASAVVLDRQRRHEAWGRSPLRRRPGPSACGLNRCRRWWRVSADLLRIGCCPALASGSRWRPPPAHRPPAWRLCSLHTQPLPCRRAAARRPRPCKARAAAGGPRGGGGRGAAGGGAAGSAGGAVAAPDRPRADQALVRQHGLQAAAAHQAGLTRRLRGAGGEAGQAGRLTSLQRLLRFPWLPPACTPLLSLPCHAAQVMLNEMLQDFELMMAAAHAACGAGSFDATLRACAAIGASTPRRGPGLGARERGAVAPPALLA